MKKIAFILALTLALCAVLCACSGSEGSPQESVPAEEDDKGINFNAEGNELEMKQYETTNPVVAMKIKDYGVVVVELYPDVAPNTVNNFIYLVKKGFYDNNTIHRMKPDFVIQGGDPLGAGYGGPGYSIAGEFAANGFTNELGHTEGVISMARTEDYDSAGSQFFIMLSAKYRSSLDGKYAAFGKVIDGMDVCHEIEKIKYYNSSSGKLNQNLTIEKMVVDTKGVDYPDPVTIPD